MSDLKPEEQARVLIDEMLAEAGWAVVPRSEYSEIQNAQAVTEALTKGNCEADYLLFLDGKAIGVLEAKRKEKLLDGVVADQTAKYSAGTLSWYQTWTKPLPFLFMSNGDTLLFKNKLDSSSKFEPIKKMFTPKQLVKKAAEFGVAIDSEFAALPMLPPVGPNGLRLCQREAIEALELAFKHGDRRALLDIATGAGKTYTACMICYRQLNYTKTERILYLVDRTNLGVQTESEFASFRLTESGVEFSKIYSVLRPRHFDANNDDDMRELSKSNVCICTIQRLFSILKGEVEDDDVDEAKEEESFFSDDDDDSAPPVELGDNLKLSSDFFDTIIVDECHRSIYSRWGKVLKYFKTARIIGLTATPTPQAYAFFQNDNKPTYRYSRQQSYADGINVPPRIYRIKTEVTESGGVIGAGDTVIEVTKKTGATKRKKQKDTSVYTNAELDRSVVNPTQIEKVITEYRDVIYDRLFPNRIPENGEPDYRYIPKTLFFAKNRQHARNIIETIERVFACKFPEGRVPEGFVQEITCSIEKPNDRIKAFRNDKNFRIAVTVTLVATGTDVKPVEVVAFMRDVRSEVLYIQMVGRGCRSVSDDKLRTVTPNADTKENFVLLDAVGVSQSEKSIPNACENGKDKKPMRLADLLERIAHGEVSDANLELLAEKCSTIHNKTNEEHNAEFYDIAGFTLRDFSLSIFAAFENSTLPDYVDINEPNNERKKLVSPVINNKDIRSKLVELNAGYQSILNPGQDKVIYSEFLEEDAIKHTSAFEKYINEPNNERKKLVSPVINNKNIRSKLVELNAGYQSILNPGQDKVIYSEFLEEDAIKHTSAFEKYINEHCDEIEALRIIYHDESKSITNAMLLDLQQKLLTENRMFRAPLLWDYYKVFAKENKKTVIPLKGKNEIESITNLIQLVRFAYGRTETLQSIQGIASQRFGLYIGQRLGATGRDFTPAQVEVLRKVAEYIAQNGCTNRKDLFDFDQTLAIQAIQIYTPIKAESELDYLSKFLLQIKAA